MTVSKRGRAKRGLVWLLVTSFVLPLLLTLVPLPTLSAAEALERDAKLYLCRAADSYPSDEGAPAASHAPSDCVLCTLGCSVCGAAPTPGSPLASVYQTVPQGTEPLARDHLPVPLALQEGPSPRGPPLV